jgi:hypothetical protein
VLEDEVDGVAEDAAPPPTARRAHDDDLALAPLRLVDDRPLLRAPTIRSVNFTP